MSAAERKRLSSSSSFADAGMSALYMGGSVGDR